MTNRLSASTYYFLAAHRLVEVLNASRHQQESNWEQKSKFLQNLFFLAPTIASMFCMSDVTVDSGVVKGE